MTTVETPLPPGDQLIDLVGNCSVGIAVTGADGRLLVVNKAQVEMMGGEHDSLGYGLLIDRQPGQLSRLLQQLHSDSALHAVSIEYQQPDGRVRHGLLDAVWVGDLADGHGYWVCRPELERRLPVAANNDEAISDAAEWIQSVDNRPWPARGPREEHAGILAEFFATTPVAIHLIGPNGNVMYANPADVNLVNFQSEPARYIGQHIRQIYDDQNVVDDFLSRWDKDSPIINFRANFVTRDGARKPVQIFSTAKTASGKVNNTRCFVFADHRPELPRDTIRAFSWPN
jgi:PAS domain-containing protein